ncbi:MAG: hypothetical protein GKR89_06330 [Candidatus Latescibacteria bacterium]|nr:hypothetical protein [Candidatus Latescibacterota bacterium]
MDPGPADAGGLESRTFVHRRIILVKIRTKKPAAELDSAAGGKALEKFASHAI